MFYEGDERTTEMRLTQNRKTIQALFLHGSDEPFGVGIGAGVTICSATRQRRSHATSIRSTSPYTISCASFGSHQPRRLRREYRFQ